MFLYLLLLTSLDKGDLEGRTFTAIQDLTGQSNVVFDRQCRSVANRVNHGVNPIGWSRIKLAKAAQQSCRLH